MANFVHIHNHSYYSIQEGICSPKKLLDKAKELGYNAFALTDNGVMYGIMEFYYYAKSINIKPIIGVELYIANDSRFRKDSVLDKNNYRIILLAKDYIGYQNLNRIVSAAFLEGFYYKPRADLDLLYKYRTNLIVILHNRQSELSINLLNKGIDSAINVIKKYKDIFDDNLYIELVSRNQEKQIEFNKALFDISLKTSIPVVGSNDIYYADINDAEAHDVMSAIQMQTILNDPRRFKYIDLDLSIKDENYMLEYFKDIPQAIENTIKISDNCNFEMPKFGWVFPDVKLDDDCIDTDEMLRKLAYNGIKQRLQRDMNDEEKKRMEYELEIIRLKGFASYFLTVKEICDFMHQNNIATNTRGSAAGSFVSYALNITRANPLFFNLPFERFLNPLRPKAPDIDLDISHIDRDRVIKWTIERYGSDKVAQIVTFGTMAAKNAFKDVARVFGKQFEETNKIAKFIPVIYGKSDLKKALEEVSELKRIYENNDDYKKIFDIALKLEGCVRHASQHACGILITPKPCTDYVPLSRDPNNNPVCQYDQRILEDMGLLKMDYLGLKNLTIITQTCNIIKKRHNIDVDIENVPLDDEKTFNLLSKAETFGVFQLESNGMRKYLKELKPTTIFDIQAMLALFRPGPLDNIPEYIKRKNNPQFIKYLHPDLEPILKQTFGVLVYQDDVLLIAIKFGGYDWGEVDAFRKAMGKKIPEIMKQQENKFVEGCVKNGYNIDLAKKMFELFAPFAAYGFNKAHAAAYSLTAYQTAYLKAHYPIDFMASLLQVEVDNIDQTILNISECNRMGIKILPPDINISLENFTVVDDNTIRFGLLAIKGLGENIVQAIIKERKLNGAYKNFTDFLIRHDTKVVNKKAMEVLIKSGAFDCFNDRKLLLTNMEYILNFVKQSSGKNDKQSSLFDLINDDEKKYIQDLRLQGNEFTNAVDLYNYEKEILGLCISIDILSEINKNTKNKILNISSINDDILGSDISIIGILKNIRLIKTKKNENMFFCTLNDGIDNIDVTVFPNIYTKYKDFFESENFYLLKGKLDKRNDKYNIILSDIKKVDLNELMTKKIRKKTINKDNNDNIYFCIDGLNENCLMEMKNILNNTPPNGNKKLIFLFDGKKICVDGLFNDDIIDTLNSIKSNYLV